MPGVPSMTPGSEPATPVVYNFATDLSQITYPARSLANVGRGPSRANIHVEGEIDQPARTLAFRMWEPGSAGTGEAGDAKAPGSEAEARIEGDRAYVRPAGGEWKEVEDFSASFAPDNDPLAYLAGMVNVREMPAETSLPGSEGVDEDALTFHVSRFTFQMDGPTYAAYLRDRLESQLRGTGRAAARRDVGGREHLPGADRQLGSCGWTRGACRSG